MDRKASDFGIAVFDAGSSGYRISVFRAVYNTQLEIQQVCYHKFDEDPLSKVHVHEVRGHVGNAINTIASACQSMSLQDAYLSFGATAGFRILETDEQNKRMSEINSALITHNSINPCKIASSVVLRGLDEGFYTFLSVNYAIMQAGQKSRRIIEIGGQSLQTAFESPECLALTRSNMHNEGCFSFEVRQGQNTKVVGVRVRVSENLGTNDIVKSITDAGVYPLAAVDDAEIDVELADLDCALKNAVSSRVTSENMFHDIEESEEIQVVSAPYYIYREFGLIPNDNNHYVFDKWSSLEFHYKLNERKEKRAFSDRFHTYLTAKYITQLFKTINVDETHKIHMQKISWEFGAAVAVAQQVVFKNNVLPDFLNFCADAKLNRNANQQGQNDIESGHIIKRVKSQQSKNALSAPVKEDSKFTKVATANSGFSSGLIMALLLVYIK